jgi:hypothetical protein
MSEEQHRLHEACEQHRFVLAAKPRQVGFSTYVCAVDAIKTWFWDHHGAQANTFIVSDIDAKASERIKTCVSVLTQMGVRFRHLKASRLPDRIEFPGGSVIYGVGAGGSRVASSYTVHRYHLTELPYWQDATATYGSIMPALTSQGELIIETTMDVCDPLPRRLWTDANNGLFKLFIKTEECKRFRADPEGMDEVKWRWCRDELGYTNKEAAAWFLKALDTEHAGDIESALHAYPQKEEHLFMVRSGRWFSVNPVVVAPLHRFAVTAASGTFYVDIFKEPKDTSGHLHMAIDTATGATDDRSAIVLLDARDRSLCASFVNQTIWTDDLSVVAKAMQEKYTTLRRVDGSFVKPGEVVEDATRRTPQCFIEGNGVGKTTYQQFIRRGGVGEEFRQAPDTAYNCLRLAKRFIESGDVFGPQELFEESNELHRDGNGKFVGRKDLAMCIGMALTAMERTPYKEPAKQETFDHSHEKAIIRKIATKKRRWS